MQIRKEEEIYQENILFNVQVHCSHLHCRQSFLYHHSFLMSNRGSWCNMPSPEGSKYPPQLPITLPQRPGQYQFRRKCHCPPPRPHHPRSTLLQERGLRDNKFGPIVENTPYPCSPQCQSHINRPGCHQEQGIFYYLVPLFLWVVLPQLKLSEATLAAKVVI